MALILKVCRYAAIASYGLLAVRLIALRIQSHYRLLLTVCLFQIITAAALMPFETTSPQYVRPWIWVQVGVIILNIAVAVDVALKSGEGFPLRTWGTIGMLAGLLVISGIATVYFGVMDGVHFTLTKPVVAVVLSKRYAGLALGCWGILVAGFYATAAKRPERPNVQRYRWGIIAFFMSQCAFYFVLQSNAGSGTELLTALALLPTILIMSWLAWSLSAAGNRYPLIQTRFSGLSTAELKEMYSQRSHGDTPGR